MNDGVEKKELSFRQNVNSFIGFGMLLMFFYPVFNEVVALVIVLPLFLIVVGKKMNLTTKTFFDREKNISIFEMIVLIFLLSAINALILIILMGLGLGTLFDSSKYDNITLFRFIILGSIIEEFIFRGLGTSVLKKYGKVFSIIVTTLIFSIPHVGARTIIALPGGITLGLLMILSKNIVYPILAHILTNSWLLSWSSMNVFVILSSENSNDIYWMDYKITVILNLSIILISILILWKRPFFKELIDKCNPKKIYASVKKNRELYKEFFSLGVVKGYFIIMILISIWDLMLAFLRLIM